MGQAQWESIYSSPYQRMYHFSKKVKQEFNTNCQVSVFASLNKEALRPGLSMKKLLQTEELKNNSDVSPLFIKLIPATKDSIETKTIYIGETDEDGKFTYEYKRRIIGNSDDLKTVIKSADGLIHLSSPDDVLIRFEDMNTGEE